MAELSIGQAVERLPKGLYEAFRETVSLHGEAENQPVSSIVDALDENYRNLVKQADYMLVLREAFIEVAVRHEAATSGHDGIAVAPEG